MASASKSFATFLFSALLAAVLASGFQFEVGEHEGWKIPTGKEPQTYNEWAAKNRFHIGDAIHFKYQKDSVLVVTSADYLNCNTSNPISKYEDGNTVFQFDRPGFFYFISGQPGHCRSGQRLIIRVMHASHAEAPAIAPSPAVGRDSGDWGQSGVSSGTMLSAVSCLLMTVTAGVFAMSCLFM
ncbi:hypothetical protein CDL12_19317 [Handroanthus impetiginosus]|uniref:Phytocyanin domain-containing protein n=1 Tax=Handroanthus impetiginosus TaxID=429701 RepID=A0A2G9GS48_9LAMI|nr:hypothetical protein CDL12_19317 [Handroanthus impetiginosus]